MKKGKKSGTPVRRAFDELAKEQGITKEDLAIFEKISALMARTEGDSKVSCSGNADKCISGDCGYKEGGCGNDERCKYCDSCMISWDTCTSSMCGTSDF